MSEIKGQLLGIVLTIAVFGIVFAAMTVAFQKVSQSVEDKATSAVNASIEPTTASNTTTLGGKPTPHVYYYY